MTATNEAPQLACPNCGGGNGVALSTGARLCLSCQNEWDPTDERFATLPPAGDGIESAVNDAVETLVDEVVDALAEVREALQGRRVTFTHVFDNVPAEGVVTVLDGDGLATVKTDLGEVFILEPDEVTVIDPTAAPIEQPDEVVEAVGTTMLTMAGLILRAGATCFTDDDPNGTFKVPAGGWIPDDAAVIPVIEQASAYAVATLIHAFALPLETVLAAAQALTPETTDQETNEQ